MAIKSPLDELLSIPGPVGDVTRSRTYGDQAPLPTEGPEETTKRVVQQNAQKQAMQRIRGADLARRDIPSFLDEKGEIQPVRDATGAALTGHDSRNNVAYDSTGAPKKLTFDEAGAPKLSDPFDNLPVYTDPKTGSRYQRAPGLPWKYLGEDTAVAEKAKILARDKENAALATTLGRKLTLDEHTLKEGTKQLEEEWAAITTGVPSLTDIQDPAEAQAFIEAHFNQQYSAADANRKTGWFGRGDYTTEAKTRRAAIDAEKAAMSKRVQDFFATSTEMRARKELMDQQRQFAGEIAGQRLQDQAAIAGVQLPTKEQEAQRIKELSQPVARPTTEVKDEARQPVTQESASATLDKVQQAPMTAIERLKETISRPDPAKGKSGFLELLPFASSGADIAALGYLAEAAGRLENNQETQEDLALLKDYVDRNTRDKTFGAKVVDVVAMLPAFAGELYLTGGIYTASSKGTILAAKEGLKKLATNAGKELLEKKIAQFGIKAVGSTVGSIAQTIPAAGLRIYAETMERQLPGVKVTEKEAGELQGVIEQEGDDLVPALIKATGSQFTEVWSERTGGALKFMPGAEKLKAIKTGLMARWFKANPGAPPGAFTTFLKRAGWHGVVGEMFEERVAGVARGIGAAGTTLVEGGTGEEAAGEFFQNAIPTLEQLAVEGVAFAVPGAGITGYGMYRNRRFQAKLGEKATQFQEADHGMNGAIAVLDDPNSTPEEKQQAATAAAAIDAAHSGGAAFIVGQHRDTVDEQLDELDITDKDEREVLHEFIDQPGPHAFASQSLGSALIEGGDFARDARILDEQLQENGVDQPERRAAMVNHVLGSMAMARTVSQVVRGEDVTNKAALALLTQYGVVTKETKPNGDREYALDARALNLLPPSIAEDIGNNVGTYKLSNALARDTETGLAAGITAGMRDMITQGRENIRRAAAAIAPWAPPEPDAFEDDEEEGEPPTGGPAPTPPAPTPPAGPTPAPPGPTAPPTGGTPAPGSEPTPPSKEPPQKEPEKPDENQPQPPPTGGTPAPQPEPPAPQPAPEPPAPQPKPGSEPPPEDGDGGDGGAPKPKGPTPQPPAPPTEQPKPPEKEPEGPKPAPPESDPFKDFDDMFGVGVDRAAHQAATSPINGIKTPSQAQLKAGNYQKGPWKVGGLKISIENPAGTKRRPQWPALISHYGYIRGSTGKDKDHIDVFIRPGTPKDWHGPVFVVNQTNASGAFDEHKAIIGVRTAAEALAEYNGNYEAGWDRAGSVAEFRTMEAFRKWATGAVRRTAPAQGSQLHPGGATPLPDLTSTEQAEAYGRTHPEMAGALRAEQARLSELTTKAGTLQARVDAATKAQLYREAAEDAEKAGRVQGVQGMAEPGKPAPIDPDSPEGLARFKAVARKLVDLGHTDPRSFTATLLAKMTNNADKLTPGMLVKAWSFAQDYHSELPDATRGDFTKILEDLRKPAEKPDHGIQIGKWYARKGVYGEGEPVVYARPTAVDLERVHYDLFPNGKNGHSEGVSLTIEDFKARFVLEEDAPEEDGPKPPAPLPEPPTEPPQPPTQEPPEPPTEQPKPPAPEPPAPAPEPPKGPTPPEPEQFPGPIERLPDEDAWKKLLEDEFDAQLADYRKMGETLGFTVEEPPVTLGSLLGGGHIGYFDPATPEKFFLSKSGIVGMAMQLDHGKSWIQMAFSEEFYHMMEFWAAGKSIVEVEKQAAEVFREALRLNPAEAQVIYERYGGRESHSYMGHEYIRMVMQAKWSKGFTDLYRTPYSTGESADDPTKAKPGALIRVFKKILEWMRRLFKEGELKRQYMLEEKLAQMQDLIWQGQALNPNNQEGSKPTTAEGFAELIKDRLITNHKVTRKEMRDWASKTGLDEKQIDEWTELGINRANQIVAHHALLSPLERYRRIVQIYENQPNLSEKTGMSRELQAYSTPGPLAYFASRLARVADAHYIGEATAGNGALLVEADPRRLVRVNEIDEKRAARLKYLGFKPLVRNVLSGKIFDARDIEAMPLNPPFGPLKENGVPTGRQFYVSVNGYQYKTTRLDYYIALKSLEDGLRDNGRAVLLIGGVKEDMKDRAEGYGNTAAIDFFTTLSQNYNVTTHVTVSGDLYMKQGAGWPVDVLVIEGRKKSTKFKLPSAIAPRILKTWEELGNLLNAHENPPKSNREPSGGSPRKPGDDQGPPVIPPPASPGDDSGPDGKPGKPPGQDRPTPPEPTEPTAPEPPRDNPTEPGGRTGNDDGRPEQPRGGLTESEHQVPYEPESTVREPDGMLTPTNLAEPQQNALERMKDDVGDLDVFVAEKLQYVGKGATPEQAKAALLNHFFAEQVDAIALGIWNHERGYAMIVGDQTGIGKGRVAAGMIRYALKNGMTPIFLTHNDGLYMDMLRDLAGIGMYDKADPFKEVRPFFTQTNFNNDSGTPNTLEDLHGNRWKLRPAAQKAGIAFMTENGDMPIWQPEDAPKGKKAQKTNVVFTTYSQIQGPSGVVRVDALKAIAPSAFLILDESHLGAGSSSRNVRLSEMQQTTKGVYYSSATYCKRPQAIALYSRTSISATGIPVEDLVAIMERGKQPLQQVVAAMLAIDGCYIRRERDFKGIKFKTVVTKDEAERKREFEMAGNFIELSRGVLNVDRIMGKGMRELSRTMAEAGIQFRETPQSRPQSPRMASRNPFANTFYILSQQYTMAMKAKAVVEETVRRVKEGGGPLTESEQKRLDALNAKDKLTQDEKVERQTLIDSQKPQQVVIQLNFTNEGPLEQISGGNFELTFNSLLKRYLRNVGQIKLSIPGAISSQLQISLRAKSNRTQEEEQWLADLADGDQIRWNMLEDPFPDIAITALMMMNGTPAKIAAVKAAAESIKQRVREAFIRTSEIIDTTDLGEMPLSPIDYIRDRLASESIESGDYTGRKTMVKEGKLVPKKEDDVQGKKQLENQFQSGKIRVLILNSSGSTGISLHSSEKEATNHFQRVMILAQPSPEINEFMQTLGRINRTGQVNKPEYVFLRSSLPAEYRLAVFLMKKMSSLNANTTSATDSDITAEMDVADLFNQFGDEAVEKYLRAYAGDAVEDMFWKFERYRYDEHGGVRTPAEQVEAFIRAESSEPGKLTSVITGAMAAVDPETATEFYDYVTEEFRSLIKSATEAGENPFVAQAYDYQAKTISSSVIFEGAKSGSIFSEDASLEKVEIANVQEPVTPDKAAQMAQDGARSLFLPQGIPGRLEETRIPRPAVPSATTSGPIVSQTARSRPSRWQRFSDAIDAKLREVIDNRRGAEEWEGPKGQERWREWVAGRETHWNGIRNKARAQADRIGERVIVEVGGVMTLGVIVDVNLNEKSPGQLSSSDMVIAVNTSSRKGIYKMPLTKAADDVHNYRTKFAEHQFRGHFETDWEKTKRVLRHRYIITGNILGGYRALQERDMLDHTAVITYTKDDGTVGTGIQMPEKFAGFTEAVLKDGADLIRYVVMNRRVATVSPVEAVIVNQYGRLVLAAPATNKGNPITQNQKLRDLAGRDFAGWRYNGKKYLAVEIDPDKAFQLMDILTKELGFTIRAPEISDAQSQIRSVAQDRAVLQDAAAEDDELPPEERESGHDPILGVNGYRGARIGDTWDESEEVFDEESAIGEMPVKVSPKPTGAFKGRVVSRPAAVEAMLKIFRAAGRDVRARVGRIAGRRDVTGVWKDFPEIIRTRKANDIGVAAHEVGHGMQKLLYSSVKASALKSLPKSVKAELMKLGRALYGARRPHTSYTTEGFAEFIRIYLTQDNAKLIAPATHDYLLNTVLPMFPNVEEAFAAAKEVIDQYRAQGDVNATRANIVNPLDFAHRLANFRRAFTKGELVRKWIDEFEPLRNLVAQLHSRHGVNLEIDNDPERIARVRRGQAPGIVKYMANTAMIDFGGNVVSGSLREALAPVEDRMGDFGAFLYAHRALERLGYEQDASGAWVKKGGIVPKDPGISADQAMEVVAQLGADPKFRLAAEAVWEWNAGLLNYVRQSSPSLAPTIDRITAASKHYIPLMRWFDPEELRTIEGDKSGNALKKMIGSGRQILEPFPTMLQQAQKLVELAHKRQVLDAVIRIGSGYDSMGYQIEEVPRDRIRHQLRLGDIAKQLEDMGLDLTGLDEDAILTFFAPAILPKGRDPILAHVVNGKTKWYYVDPRLFDALEGVDLYRLPKAFDLLLGAPARLFRLGTTGLRASFGLFTNPARDLPTFLMQTQSDKSPPVLFGMWLKSMARLADPRRLAGRKDAWIDLFERTGIQVGQPLGTDIALATQAHREMHHGMLRRVVTHPLDALREAFSLTEAAPRIAELELIAEEVGWDGKSPMTQAQMLSMALAAKGVTLDFSAAGSIGKKVNQAIPFFNATIRGTVQAWETYQRNPLRFVLRGLTWTTIPALMLWLINKQEDWYDDMPWRDRYLYFNIRFGNKILQIPRSPEYGNYFGVVPEAILDSWHKQDPQGATEAVRHMLATHNPLDLPPFFRMMKEQYHNRVAFFDRPIVPKSEEEMIPGEQRGPYTSGLAKTLGDLFPDQASPRRIDAGIRALTGGAFSDFAVGGENFLKLLGVVGKNREFEASDLPVFGRAFRRGGVESSVSLAVTKFYDEWEQANQRQRSTMRPETATDRRRRLMLEDAKKAITVLSLARQAATTTEQQAVLNRRVREIATQAVEIAPPATEPPRKSYAEAARTKPAKLTGRVDRPQPWKPVTDQAKKKTDLPQFLGF